MCLLLRVFCFVNTLASHFVWRIEIRVSEVQKSLANCSTRGVCGWQWVKIKDGTLIADWVHQPCRFISIPSSLSSSSWLRISQNSDQRTLCKSAGPLVTYKGLPDCVLYIWHRKIPVFSPITDSLCMSHCDKRAAGLYGLLLIHRWSIFNYTSLYHYFITDPMRCLWTYELMMLLSSCFNK